MVYDFVVVKLRNKDRAIGSLRKVQSPLIYEISFRSDTFTVCVEDEPEELTLELREDKVTSHLATKMCRLEFNYTICRRWHGFHGSCVC